MGLFIFLNFSTVASATQNPDEILFQTITESEAQELSIKIPAQTPPGFKSLEVQVSGMGKEAEFKRILFCKELVGVINWDYVCPELTVVQAQTALEVALTRNDLPSYDPLDHPKRTTNTAIIAFEALTAITGAVALATQLLDKPNPISSRDNDSQGYPTGLSKAAAPVATTQLGRGDKSRSWIKPINQKTDNMVAKSGNRISGFSPLATRILSGGNYQRSLIGSFSLLIHPFAIGLGIFSSLSLHQEALPPSLGLILTLLVLGILDAFAGLLASAAFAMSVLVELFSRLLIMGIIEDKFPKSEKLEKWTPTGNIEMLVMIIIGYLLALEVQSRYPNARTYALVSFVILNLPGFQLKILTFFGKEGAKDWRVTKFGKIAYRVLGVVALEVLIYIVLSGLLISNGV